MFEPRSEAGARLCDAIVGMALGDEYGVAHAINKRFPLTA
jgi:hypothetical protein